MLATTTVSRLLEIFTCPISLQLMAEPVSAPCGHTFESIEIRRAVAANARCPECRNPLNINQLTPNLKIKQAIGAIIEEKQSIFLRALLDENLAQIQQIFSGDEVFRNLLHMRIQDGKTAIELACSERKFTVFTFLFRFIPALDIADSNGNLFLHRLILEKNYEALHLLPHATAAFVGYRAVYEAALLEACFHNDTQAASIFLAKGAKADNKLYKKGYYNLSWAVKNNNPTLVSLLLLHKTLLNNRAFPHKLTALMIACQRDISIEVFNLLLEEDEIDLNIVSDARCALSNACSSGNVYKVTALLSHAQLSPQLFQMVLAASNQLNAEIRQLLEIMNFVTSLIILPKERLKTEASFVAELDLRLINTLFIGLSSKKRFTQDNIIFAKAILYYLHAFKRGLPFQNDYLPDIPSTKLDFKILNYLFICIYQQSGTLRNEWLEQIRGEALTLVRDRLASISAPEQKRTFLNQLGQQEIFTLPRSFFPCSKTINQQRFAALRK